MGNADSHDLESSSERSLLIGKTAAGAFIPVKVVDDGSGLGKVVTTTE